MKRLILVLFALMAMTLMLCGCDTKREEVRIREIPDVEDWVNAPGYTSVVIRCYMIDKPPADFSELRDLAETHLDEHWDDMVSPDDENTMYKCFFYRVSKKMPYGWDVNESPFVMGDYIDNHTDDMIIAVRWTTEDAVREYSIMKRSDSEVNYGDILEEVDYKGTSQIEG